MGLSGLAYAKHMPVGPAESMRGGGGHIVGVQIPRKVGVQICGNVGSTANNCDP